MIWKENISDIQGGRIEKAKVESQRRIAEELKRIGDQLERLIDNRL